MLRDQAIDIVGPGVKRLAASECEKPMRERRRAQRRRGRRVHEAGDVIRSFGRHAPAYQVERCR